MKALLLKDFYMAKAYCRVFLLIIFVFAALSVIADSNIFFVFYPCMFASMLPVTLLGYDERSKWDKYCATLPYTKAQIVSSKYLIGLVGQIFVLVLTGILRAVKMHYDGVFCMDHYLVLMAMLIFMSFLVSSIPLPFMFKFGVEKGRIAYYVTLGVICGGSVIAASLFDNQMQTPISFGVILVLLTVASIVLYACSWYLAIRFYEKREV